MWAPVAPQPRLSLNLSALLDSRRIVILINGAAKWRTYLAAAARRTGRGDAGARGAAPDAHAGAR